MVGSLTRGGAFLRLAREELRITCKDQCAMLITMVCADPHHSQWLRSTSRGEGSGGAGRPTAISPYKRPSRNSILLFDILLVLPSLVTLSAAEPSLSAPWAWVAGAALGVAIHLTNVLPDLDDDARTGVRGLPHRLGRRVSAVIAAVALDMASLR